MIHGSSCDALSLRVLAYIVGSASGTFPCAYHETSDGTSHVNSQSCQERYFRTFAGVIQVSQ